MQVPLTNPLLIVLTQQSDMSKAEFAYEIVYVNADAGCGAFDAADGDRTTFGNVGNGIATSRMMQNATTSATLVQCR